MKDNPYIVQFEIESNLTPTEFAVFLSAVMPKAHNIDIVDETGEIHSWKSDFDENLSADELRSMYEKGTS